MFGRKKNSARHDTAISGSPHWRCPNCGSVHEKKEEAAARIKALELLEQQGATVVDLARCADCGVTFNTKDVYSGQYDC